MLSVYLMCAVLAVADEMLEFVIHIVLFVLKLLAFVPFQSCLQSNCVCCFAVVSVCAVRTCVCVCEHVCVGNIV